MHAQTYHQNAITESQSAPLTAVDGTVPDSDQVPATGSTTVSAEAFAAAMKETAPPQINPLVDLAHPKGDESEVIAPLAEPEPIVAPVEAPVAAPTHRSSSRIVATVGVIVALLAVGGGTYGFLEYTKSQRQQALAPPPAPTQVAAPAPAPPAAVPDPAPVTPPAANVTAPIVTPTKNHPQSVTVTSPNGLWIRSTPDSSNRSNIISWIPDGGNVSVDEVGDFWWHGTYKGVTGYFAANYTH